MANHVDGIDMEYTLEAWGDVPPLHARELYAQYDAKRAEFVDAATYAHEVELHQAAMRRIAELERERDAMRDLFKRANEAKRIALYNLSMMSTLVDNYRAERDAAQARSGAKSIALEELRARIAEYEGDDKRWHSFETVQAIVKERDVFRAQLDAATLRAEHAEANARGYAEYQSEYVKMVGCFRAANAAKRTMRAFLFCASERAAQAEADVVRLLELFRLQSIRSFVAGAGWWEFHQTQSTMWASARDEAWAHAENRFPFVRVDHREVDSILPEYDAMVKKYLEAK